MGLPHADLVARVRQMIDRYAAAGHPRLSLDMTALVELVEWHEIEKAPHAETVDILFLNPASGYYRASDCWYYEADGKWYTGPSWGQRRDPRKRHNDKAVAYRRNNA